MPKAVEVEIGPSRKTVVVVEDSDEVRSELTRLLNQTPDLRCLFAFRSAEEALPAILNAPPDVVLMDIRLPGMSGIECLRILKRKIPTLEVLVLTVCYDSKSLFEALKAGANGYLIKSSSPEILYSAIRDISQGGTPLTGHIAREVVKYFREEHAAPSSEGNLTPRQNIVIKLLAEGDRYKEIADKLNLSSESIKLEVRKICKKLEVRNKTEAIVKIRCIRESG